MSTIDELIKACQDVCKASPDKLVDEVAKLREAGKKYEASFKKVDNDEEYIAINEPHNIVTFISEAKDKNGVNNIVFVSDKTVCVLTEIDFKSKYKIKVNIPFKKLNRIIKETVQGFQYDGKFETMKEVQKWLGENYHCTAYETAYKHADKSIVYTMNIHDKSSGYNSTIEREDWILYNIKDSTKFKAVKNKDFGNEGYIVV